MKKKLFLIIAILGSMVIGISACKEQDDGDALISLEASTASGTGCRGRNGDVKSFVGPGLYFPWQTGTSHSLGQTWFGTFSHRSTGREHALDFNMEDNVTDVYPVGPGTVMAVKEDSNTTCTSNCPYANYVEVDHGNGFYARYLHFAYNAVNVAVGDQIDQTTDILGKAGNTGWSTGPHLHFEILDFEENCTVTYTLEGVYGGNLQSGNNYLAQAKSIWGAVPALSEINGNVYRQTGVELTTGFVWRITAGSSISFSGRVTDGKSKVAVFLLTDPPGDSYVAGSFQSANVNADGTFSNVTYSPSVSAGSYYIAISSSENGSWNYSNPPRFVVY